MSTDDSQEAKFQQARNLYQLGDRDQALALLYSVVAVDPRHIDAWWAIAQIAKQLRQKRQAAEQVLSLDPNHEDARQLLNRIQQLDVPTPVIPKSPGNSGTPPASYQVSPGPPPPSIAAPFEFRQPSEPEPTDFGTGAPTAVPAPPVPVVPPPEPPSAPEARPEPRRVEREVRPLQPFLILNGGCTSGCFSVVLTVLAVAVLAFLLIGGGIQEALRDAGALRPNEGATASLIAGITLTVLATFVQSALGALPIDLSGLIPAQNNLAGSDGTLFNQIVSGIWSLFGYPASVGETILTRLSRLGPQLSQSAWLVLAVFLGFWIILAFLFVFLRARGSRLLHWFLSTVGLWIVALLAIGVGLLLYRAVSGGG